MVDIFGATAADDAIQFPIFIDHEQVMQLAGGAALSLLPGDSFAGILDDLHVGRYGFSGEYTPTMNPRRANDEPEPRIPRIDFGFIGGNGRIGGLEIGFDPVGPLLYFGRFRLEAAEVVINRGHVGVFGTEGGFEDLDGTKAEWPGSSELALATIRHCLVVELDGQCHGIEFPVVTIHKGCW